MLKSLKVETLGNVYYAKNPSRYKRKRAVGPSKGFNVGFNVFLLMLFYNSDDCNS